MAGSTAFTVIVAIMVQQSIRLWFPSSGDSGEAYTTHNNTVLENAEESSQPAEIASGSSGSSDTGGNLTAGPVNLPLKDPNAKPKRVIKAIKKKERKRKPVVAKKLGLKCKRGRKAKPLDPNAIAFTPPDGTPQTPTTPMPDVEVASQSPSIAVTADDVDSASVDLLDLLDNERNISDMLASALVGSDLPGDIDNATDTDANTCTLDPVIALEAALVSSRVELDGLSQENASLNTAMQLLNEEIDDYKKVSNSQKQEIKRLKNDNDLLRREVSRCKGIRKYTETPQETKPSDNLTAVSAKLASVKECMINVASTIINAIEDNDSDVNATSFTTVKSRRRSRDVITIDEAPETQTLQAIAVLTDSTMMRSSAVSSIRGGGAPTPTAPEVTSTQSYAQAAASRASRTTTPAPHHQKHPIIIGTSLIKGAGGRLNKLGIPAECYSYPGSEIPRIRSRLKHVIPEPNKHSLCVLQAGGNDAERRPVESVIAQYDTLIDEVRRCTPGTHIMISAIPPRRNNNLIINKIERLNAHLQQKCSRDQGLHYVQVYPDYVHWYKRDLVHFNRRGDNVYAERLASAIEGFHGSQVQNAM